MQIDLFLIMAAITALLHLIDGSKRKELTFLHTRIVLSLFLCSQVLYILDKAPMNILQCSLLGRE